MSEAPLYTQVAINSAGKTLYYAYGRLLMASTTLGGSFLSGFLNPKPSTLNPELYFCEAFLGLHHLGRLLLVRCVVPSHLDKCEIPLYGRLLVASTTLGGSFLSGVYEP